MKRLMMTTCALVLIGSTAASADCASELAALSGGAAEPGAVPSLTPEGAASAEASGAAAGGEAIAKDGSLAPLEQPSAEGGDVAGRAMSGDDAAAQQAGEPTAAEQAEGSGNAATRDGALERARAALAAGDEAACMDALAEARSM